MTLGQKQRVFTRCIGRLIEYAYRCGYEMSFGDAFRDPRAFGKVGEKKGYSHPSSVHKYRLAVDFNLFKDGKYLSRTEDHQFLGEFWEQLGEDEGLPLRWGGRFKDGNHYSLEHGGVK